jgi:mannose-6-phosphate isomerase-like protein (cupin superfamily)
MEKTKREVPMATDIQRVDILAAARSNDAFRREVLTGEHEQVVVMTIPPGAEIGEEVHPDTDQVLVFIDGRAEAELDGQRSDVGPNDLVFVRAGTRHNFVNRGEGWVRLITVYAPPEHPAGTVHQTKAEAEAAEREGHASVSRTSPPLSADVIDSVRGAKVIGAPTTGLGDAWSWARRPAVAVAKATGSRLILADISTRSAWTTPYGSGGVGADRRPPYSDGTTLVTREELVLLGHEYLLDQLREAEAEGVETGVWLADRPGVLALDRFLELFDVDALVVPPLQHPTLAERLAGDHIRAVRRRMSGRRLLVAWENGSVTIDEDTAA